MKIINSDLGWKTNTAGSLVHLCKGHFLWVNGGPDGIIDIGNLWLRESFDNGESWSEPRIIIPRGTEGTPLSVYMLKLKSGKLVHFVSMFNGRVTENLDESTCELYISFSDDDGKNWTELRKVAELNERYVCSGLCNAVQLKSGRVILPFEWVTKERGKSVVSAMYSDDDCKTFVRSESILDSGGGGFESGACEPCVAELPDGRIWMLMRTQNGYIYESYSKDDGETWENARPTKLPSSNAPANLLKTTDGRIIVVWHNSVRNFNPARDVYARYCLVMGATDNGGKSFYGFREIVRIDYPMPVDNWSVMYPYLAEGDHGRILVSFNEGDWVTNKARVALIEKDWIENKEVIDDFSMGRRDWCGLGSNLAVFKKSRDGKMILELSAGESAEMGMTRNIPLVSNGVVTIEGEELFKPEVNIILHDSFLLPGRSDEACVRVRFDKDGYVYAGAGVPKTEKKESGKWIAEYERTKWVVEKEIKSAEPFGKPPIAEPQVLLKRLLTFKVSINCDIGKRKSEIIVESDGKKQKFDIQLPDEKLPLGYCYLGITTKDGGIFTIRKVSVSKL